MKLYYNPYSRASRTRFMLEEIGEPYEIVRKEFADLGAPEYLKVHPLGLLPAFEDDGLVMFESAAICAYLADKYPEKKLAPAPGTRERAHYYQWLFFTMTEVEPRVMEVFSQTEALPEAERSAKLLEEARGEFAERAAVLEKHLAGKDYLLGAHFSAADVVLGSLLAWGRSFGLIDGLPNLQAYVKRVGGRPASKRARAD
jgi:glutathione S-transferase